MNYPAAELREILSIKIMTLYRLALSFGLSFTSKDSTLFVNFSFSFSSSNLFALDERYESVSHQFMPISWALSTEAISSRILMVKSSTSANLIWISPAMTMPLSKTRSRSS